MRAAVALDAELHEAARLLFERQVHAVLIGGSLDQLAEVDAVDAVD